MNFEIRKDRKPQGPKRLTHEREEYFRLMDQGLSSREACRIVGINLRTGRKWRNGHHSPGGDKKAVPPVGSEAPPSDEPSHYLREDERIHIADRVREKVSIRQIARELGRAPSTISREVPTSPASTASPGTNCAAWNGTTRSDCSPALLDSRAQNYVNYSTDIAVTADRLACGLRADLTCSPYASPRRGPHRRLIQPRMMLSQPDPRTHRGRREQRIVNTGPGCVAVLNRSHRVISDADQPVKTHRRPQ
ncbi:Helix-turn-helix domain-containing protein [Streptosporangium subroseum]|uniref:Helix-turn-helix domain-containing protein n=1 Tax=Streptosporangium subroseum TaxID=106412 RepID=A0A239AMW3_9ACTN|nr:helix-turn-helix domain-containing protein [Streptosporangium subroseum]SNR96850.1 Helix-turn-helix domain-containing protein [Streptosporangium subroseum]